MRPETAENKEKFSGLGDDVENEVVAPAGGGLESCRRNPPASSPAEPLVPKKGTGEADRGVGKERMFTAGESAEP